MNFNNLIALFHIIILPFIIYSLYKESVVFAFLALLLLIISVMIDFIERLFRKKHEIHSFLHPFADKIVVLVLLLVFTIKGLFLWPVLIVFMVRDLVVGIVRVLASRDDVEIKASKYYGSTIISLQFALVFLILVKDFLFYDHSVRILYLTNKVILIVTLVTVILAVISAFYYGIVYGRGLYRMRKFGKKLAREEMVVLANRKSGGYKHRYRRHLLRVFSRRRKAKIVYLPKRDLYKGVLGKVKNYKQVVIAGGDGTFESALNNKVLQKKSLGFFPFGTGNAYYSYFYKGKRFEYLRSRFPFSEVDLDIVELEWEDGKTETTFLGLGLDAEVIRLSTKKKYYTFHDYFAASIDVIFGKSVSYNLECNIDGRKYNWDNCFNVVLGKIPFFGFGMRSLLGKMEPDDGFVLGLASVNTHSATFNKLLRVWQLILTQLNVAKSPLVLMKGKKYHIKSKKPMALQAGGEFLGYTKWIEVKVVRKQKVLMV